MHFTLIIDDSFTSDIETPSRRLPGGVAGVLGGKTGKAASPPHSFNSVEVVGPGRWRTDSSLAHHCNRISDKNKSGGEGWSWLMFSKRSATAPVHMGGKNIGADDRGHRNT